MFTTEKIILQDLVKVFGEHPEKALSLLSEGFSKEEILAKTGQTIGVNKVSMLFKVQLPMSTPTIMAGINQTIMLSLSMVVIASMIGAGGLGDDVLRAITQLEVGLGFEGGIGIVILAIILDRLTRALVKGRDQINSGLLSR